VAWTKSGDSAGSVAAHHRDVGVRIETRQFDFDAQITGERETATRRQAIAERSNEVPGNQTVHRRAAWQREDLAIAEFAFEGSLPLDGEIFGFRQPAF
jgi:hypothetical protein